MRPRRSHSLTLMLAIPACIGLIVLAGWLTWPLLVKPDSPASPQDKLIPPSHAKMLETLNTVREQRVYETNFFGPETIESLELTLQSRDLDPRDRFAGLLYLSERHLWQGDTRAAIAHLEDAASLMAAAGDVVPLTIQHEVEFKLGLQHLRLGENENCVHCNNGESCLIPISPKGQHERPYGSQQAIEHFENALAMAPQDYTARWLLNVAHMTLGTYPDTVPPKFLVDPQHFVSERDFSRFENIAIRVGLNHSSQSGGSVVDDFDGDGDLDVITSSWGEDDDLQYFRNENNVFVYDSKQANLIGIYGGLNLLQADYDNDGDLDVLVLRGAWLGEVGKIQNSLLQNDGTGRFTDVTYECGLALAPSPTQTAAWLDFDNDGDLDLYIGNEEFPSQLFENTDGQTFVDIAAKAGVTNNRYAKGVTAGDYDEDGYTDLYVSNYNGDNRLYHNEGDKTFTDVTASANVAEPFDSFPVWFWDYNQDGHLDLFVSGYTAELDCIGYEYFDVPPPGQFSRLYQGDGRGGFKDVTRDSHIDHQLPPMGANFGDLDNDGYPDVYLGTGAPQYEALMPNLLYLNDKGERFDDITTAAGFGHLQKGHGISFADFDNDGDQDVFAEMGGAYPGDLAVNALYENPGFGNDWLTIQLIGVESNRSAIGGKVAVQVVSDGQTQTIYHWVGSGGSFGANPLRCEIGLGQIDEITQVSVTWPKSGTTQFLNDVAPNQFLVIKEQSSHRTSKALTKLPNN